MSKSKNKIKKLGKRVEKLEWNVNQQNEVIVLEKIHLNRLDHDLQEARKWMSQATDVIRKLAKENQKGNESKKQGPISRVTEAAADKVLHPGGVIWHDTSNVSEVQSYQQWLRGRGNSHSMGVERGFLDEVGNLPEVRDDKVQKQTPAKMTPAKMNTSENDTSENEGPGNEIPENGLLERWIVGDALFEGKSLYDNGKIVRRLSEDEVRFGKERHSAREYRDFWEGLMK